mgnify:CR=1 FL=1
MINNAIYKIREDHPSDYNILGYDKIIVLGKELYSSTERVLPADDDYDHERMVTYYEYTFIFEGWTDGRYGPLKEESRRDLSSMGEEEFMETLMHCYDFVRFVGDE